MLSNGLQTNKKIPKTFPAEVKREREKIMKKFLSILLVLAIILAFTACGADGKDGKDGVTPTIEISDDGYWIINGVKTEHKAIGTDGKDGIDGTNGKDGKDGVTPTIDISDDGYWVINGQKTNVRATPEEVAPENPQELQFYLKDDGTYTVSGGNVKYLSGIVIPETYKGGVVVAIEDNAFYNSKSITSVIIGDSVTSIGSSAFSLCELLESVIIGDSVTIIGEGAFSGCYALTSVTIGKSVTIIDWNAFSGCHLLTSIKFEGTVAQWIAITKESYWNTNVPATEVICSDGVVPLN